MTDAEVSRGSSPLAREIHADSAVRVLRFRFIPARAGNTSGSRARQSRRSLHPRSRGKYLYLADGAYDLLGSSPLAREILPAEHPVPQGCRFIPARAGNTAQARGPRRPLSVHPRSRGKYGASCTVRAAAAGSSPLAREIHNLYRQKAGSSRFIPARAGNTASAQRPGRSLTVHPRSRGKYSGRLKTLIFSGGSSSLAREIRDAQGARSHRQRFILARAGNTPPRPRRSSWGSVHPRSRGKYESGEGAASARLGSSSLAREIPKCRQLFTNMSRFILARAGNTAPRACLAGHHPVHPRSRGKYPAGTYPLTASAGSSSLAREILVDADDVEPRGRFILARAGNTSAPG